MSDKSTGGVRRSNGDGMRAEGSGRNTGSPRSWGLTASTGAPRGADRASADGGEARSSDEAVNHRGAKGPQFQGSVSSGKGAEIGASLYLRTNSRSCKQRCMPKRRGIRPTGSTRCMTNSIARMCWRRHGGDAVPTAVRLAWTASAFEQIEQRGVSEWLEERAQTLRTKTYRPLAVRRVYIPETQRKAETAGYTVHPGSSDPDGGGSDIGADLRG